MSSKSAKKKTVIGITLKLLPPCILIHFLVLDMNTNGSQLLVTSWCTINILILMPLLGCIFYTCDD
ncbi:hypothetical protein IC582_010157 [Cucumis melo]